MEKSQKIPVRYQEMRSAVAHVRACALCTIILGQVNITGSRWHKFCFVVPDEQDKWCQTAMGLHHSVQHLLQPPQFGPRSPIHTHTPAPGPRKKQVVFSLRPDFFFFFRKKWVFFCCYLIEMQVASQQRDFSLGLDRKQRGSLNLLHTRTGRSSPIDQHAILSLINFFLKRANL